MTDVLHGRLQIEHPPYVLERLFGLRFDPRRRAKDRVLLLESHSPHSPKLDRQNVPDHLESEGDALLNIVGFIGREINQTMRFLTGRNFYARKDPQSESLAKGLNLRAL